MRDGKGEQITKKVRSDAPVASFGMPCEGYLVGDATAARFRTCTLGHVHCTRCHRVAHRHLKGWTCGKCPGRP